jgi:O-methyltransferase
VGSWDLREAWRDYLGGLDLKGLRVLEFGPASGYLSLKMEEMGAEVVVFDLPPGTPPDLLPEPSVDAEALSRTVATTIDRVRNSWWYSHRLFGSKNKATYGDIYHLPSWLGRFDVSVFAAILLHLANPFAALRQAAAVTDTTFIVTDLYPGHLRDLAVMEFSPNPEGGYPTSWWLISPNAIVRMLKLLGFSDVRISYHQHRHHPALARDDFKVRRFFTIVANRGEAAGASSA